MKEIRTRARETAIRALYAWDINGGDLITVAEEIINMSEPPLKKDAQKYAKLIVKKVEENIENIDKEIASYIENWNFDDLGAIEKAILRASFAEFLYIKPKKHIQAMIDYINIANDYGNKKTPAFINGILSRLLKNTYQHV